MTSIDLVKNDNAKHNVLLNIDDSLEEQSKAALAGVSKALGAEKAAAILCVAGGWAGGNAKSAGKEAEGALCQTRHAYNDVGPRC